MICAAKREIMLNIEHLQADAADLSAALALNAAHVTETSSLDEAALRRMLGEAFRAVTIDGGGALLVAFEQSAVYDSPNFAWFKTRFARFVYVDRIVVAARSRGRGLAGALYRDLFDAARAAGHTRVVCEVNVDPPNPASDAFHERQNFAEVGRAKLANGKTVRYLSRAIP
jgi:hypothetical protein